MRWGGLEGRVQQDCQRQAREGDDKQREEYTQWGGWEGEVVVWSFGGRDVVKGKKVRWEKWSYGRGPAEFTRGKKGSKQ